MLSKLHGLIGQTKEANRIPAWPGFNMRVKYQNYLHQVWAYHFQMVSFLETIILALIENIGQIGLILRPYTFNATR